MFRQKYDKKRPNASFWDILLVSVMSGKAITKEVLPPLSRISALELCSLATDNPYCSAEFPNSAEKRIGNLTFELRSPATNNPYCPAEFAIRLRKKSGICNSHL